MRPRNVALAIDAAPPRTPANVSLADVVDEAVRTSLQLTPPAGGEPDDHMPLYAPRRMIYPQRVAGTFRRIKWAVLFVTLGIYYLLPFVRWDRGPNAPSQAVLIDFPNRRFYFFFIEIWPQEF